MKIGKYELRKTKPFTPRGYLLVYSMEKKPNDQYQGYNYILNKTTGVMDRKKILDDSFLSNDNIFTSFQEVENFIKENIQKIRSLRKFLNSGSIQTICYVEHNVVEKEENYEIKTTSIQLIWNRKEEKLVPIE